LLVVAGRSHHPRPTYAVSAADWQSLVEKLGLAARLADTA